LDKIAGILLIALLAIVTTVGLSYYILNQPNQTQNNPSPTPTPTQTPTPSPSETPSEPASTSKPSVPEFTVEIGDHSYIVPSYTSIDPYTGDPITHPSYTVENITIDITIKNQPFTPPDNLTNLYYGVRVKGHFEQSWTELYYITNRTNGNYLRIQSASENTVISIPQDYPQGQVDFQVEAVIATAHPLLNTNFGHWTWEASDWSNTQTITIP
jgi:cytoskeletal protein RodZ